MATGLRSLTASALTPAQEEEEVIDRRPYGSESDRAFRQGMQNMRAQGIGLRSIGKALIGDEEGATEDALKSQAVTDAAAAAGPRVQSFSRDVHNLSDFGEYARNMLLTQGPGLLTTLGGGVVGVGVRAGVQAGTKQAVKRAVKSAVKDAAGKRTAAALGAGTASTGQTLGATGPEALTMEGEGSLRERALKATSASLASGALDTLPALRLLNRSGLLGAAKGEVQRDAGRLLSRIGRESGKQALYEGFTEVAQTALERSAQKWIDKRINLLAPEEFERYVDSFAAGAVLGGAFGGGAEVVGSRPRFRLPERIQEAITLRRGRPGPARPGESVADKAARNEALLRQANDDLDALLDPDSLDPNEPDEFAGIDLLGQPGLTPTEQAVWAYQDALQRAPAAIQRALRLATSPQAPEAARLRAALQVEAWMAQNDKQRAPRAAPELSEVGQAMMPDTPAQARALAQLFYRPLRADYDPTQPLMRMVQGSLGLSDEDYAALRDYDATLSTAERKAIADRIYALSPTSPSERARLRASTAKGGGVEIDPRVFAQGVRGVGTMNYMSDRVMRSALVDLARLGNEDATNFLDSLDSKVAAAVKPEGMPAAKRRAAVDRVYAEALKQLGRSNPALLDAVRVQLRDSYDGVSPAYAAQTEVSAHSLPNTELLATDVDGNSILVDVPQQINYIRSVSGERAAGDLNNRGFRQQIADAYGKLLEVLGGNQEGANVPSKLGRMNFKLGTALLDPRSMANDNLVLYIDPKTKQPLTLGHLRADGFFDARESDNDKDPRDPDDTVQEMGAEAEGDQRVPGGDIFEPTPKREIAPQEDVIEAMTGAPVVTANERVDPSRIPREARDRPEPPDFEPSDIDEIKAEIAAVGERAAELTPEQRREEDIAGQMRELRAQLRVAMAAAKAAKARRSKIKASQLKAIERLAGKGDAPPTEKRPAKTTVGQREDAKRASESKIRAEIAARRQRRLDARPKPERVDPAAGATGKNVFNSTRKKRKDSKVGKIVAATVARLDAELQRANERDAKAREARKRAAETSASDTQVRLVLKQIGNVTEQGAAYVKAKIDALGASLQQMFEVQTLANQLRRGAINEAQFQAGVDRVWPGAKDEGDTAPKGFKRWLAERLTGPRPSARTLTNLSNAMLEWLGVDAKVTVRYAPDEELGSNVGRATPKGDGKYEIVLSELQRGAELISTLFHEVGHVVKWAAFNKADPQTREAIMRDYDEWFQQNNIDTLRSAHVLGARASAVRQQQLAEYARNGRMLKDLSAAERKYLLDFDEWFADQVARYMTTDAKANSIIAKFFKAVARQILQISRAFGSRAEPSKAVKKFLDQMRLDATARRVAKNEAAGVMNVDPEKLPKGVTPDEAVAAVDAVTQPGSSESLHSVISIFRRLPPATRTVLARMVKRKNVLATLRSKVSSPYVLRAMDNPAVGIETRMAVAFELWRAGGLKIAAVQGPFRKVWDGMLKKIGLLTESDYFEQFLVDVQAGRPVRDPRNYSVFKHTAKNANAVAKSFAALDDYYRSTVVPMAQRLFATGVGERMMNSGIPAMVEFALKMKVPTGARQQTEVGLFQARLRAANAMNSRYGKAVEGLDETDLTEVHAALQGAIPLTDLTPEQRAAYNAVRKHFDEAWEYLNAAGVEVPAKENYYPIVMLEPDQLVSMRDEFVQFFASNFESQMRAKLLKVLGGSKPSAELKAELNKKSATEMAELFYAMAMGEDPGTSVDWVEGVRPSFRYMNEQLMDFVLEGTDAQRAEFAKFREPNLSYVVVRYNEAAAKRAEFQRRFPDDDAVAKYFEKARQQGATDEQLDLMRDYLDVMMGNYGLQYPAALKSVLGGVDKVLGTKLAENPATMRRIQGFITVYQNLRLLGLATLSSVVDSLGIAVRSGRFKDAWAAYRDTFKAIRKKGGLEQMWKLAEDLGVVEATATNEALAMAYGGLHLSRTARKINDFFFQAIGLTRWTQATRVAALAMGHRFLIRHKDGKGVSARYLDELGLKPSDIVEQDGFVVMNEKVRDALLQFVDESILRPDPSQRPLWMSDPNYMLISQYKSFTYAFQNTILKRISVEFREGNYQPLLLALAYVPVMLAAELLRELIQHGPDGDPRREEWGVADYAWHATERTGMLGPREFVLDAASDPKYGAWPGTSFLGPSVAQARSLASDKAPGRKVEEALPGSSVWKHHVPMGEPVAPLGSE